MSSTRGRRSFLRLAGAGATSVLAACRGAGQTAPTAPATAENGPGATTTPDADRATAGPESPPAATPVGDSPSGGALALTPTPATAVFAQPTAAPATTPNRAAVVIGQQPDTLMPRVGSALARAEVLGALHVAPVVADDKGNWVAMGVESVPTLDNGGATWSGEGDDRHLEVTFRIRGGLKWHDGTPVTGKDMRFHWSLVMNPRFKAEERTLEEKVNAVDLVDDRTVVYKYHSTRQAREAAARGFMGLPADNFKDWRNQREPIADPLFMLVGGFLPEHILGKLDPAAIEANDFGRKPVMAGPYRFKEWVPDQTITLVANPDFVLGAPKIPTVVFRIIKDSNAQLAALRAGDVDVVTEVQGIEVERAPELDRLSAQGSYRIHYVAGTAWEHFDFNLDNDHLKERNVRKAIAHGVDRQAIVDKLLFGKTRVASSWVQPGLPPWAYDEGSVVAYPFEPARAKALLSEVGYTAGPDGILVRNGKKLQLRLTTTDASLRKSLGQMVQQQLRAIGVGIELEFLPGRGLFENTGPLKKRTFEIALYTWLSQLNPDRIDYLHSKNVPSDKNGFVGNNYMGYSNPRVDELALKGSRLLSEAERRPIYLEMQKIVTDDLPFLPLFQRVTPTVARARMQNFRPTPTATPETWNIHEWTLG